jgi:alpha-L-fucosidase
MRYLCFTTKHIDGFCLWDSALTDFKITNTPYGKDTLALLAAACHRRGIPLCLYYSVADNHQPNYPHAGRPYEFAAPQPGDQPDLGRYVEFVKGQVRELCTRYGKIHGFWWDANVLKLQDPGINAMIRGFQPGIVINNRGPDAGDFGTPERDWDDSVNSELHFSKPVEACQSIGLQSWSWRKDEDYYSDPHLLGSIQKVLAKGGNYLLNAGPKADGTFPATATRRLARIGVWFQRVQESLLDVEPANDLLTSHDVLLTRRGKTLYVHLHRQPVTDAVYLHPLVDLPRRAVVLNTGREVRADVADLPSLHAQTPNRGLRLRGLPVNRRSVVGWVIRLEF